MRQMLFDIPDQPVQPLPRVVAGAFVMHITEGALYRVRLRAIARQPENLHPRVSPQPLIDGLGLVNFVVVGDHIEASDPRAAALLEQCEQLAKEQVVFARPDDIMNLTRPQVERPGEVLLPVLPRRWDFDPAYP